MFTYIFTY